MGQNLLDALGMVADPFTLLVVVLAGIFVMRFAFYMMHMTVGLGV